MSVLVDGPSDGHAPGDFQVHLDVYDGPFDVLLGLIGKHQLDVTDVALAVVTDEFVAFVRAAGFDLERATAFLVVAATLLDLKAARLLPGPSEPDEDDLALLESRDLLFARLLQYRAFKRLAGWLADSMQVEAGWLGRDVELVAELTADMRPVVLETDAGELAGIAASVLAYRPPELVAVDHLHLPRVNVAEHAAAVSERLRATGSASFRVLCRDCTEPVEIVARFLALLELFRDGCVRFEQVAPLADLTVTWTGDQGSDPGRAHSTLTESAGAQR